VVEHGGGHWCEPTVLTGTTPQMAVVAEESFAAILPVMPFDSDDEAVRLANSGDYGLSAAVWSRDLDRARRIAGRIEAGAVSINDAALTAMVYDAAKQSFKRSGLGGSRMGTASLARFHRQQAFLINDGTPSPWWYPAVEP
jgi:succinate-semialdehyde dehydrogenase / glutarate-semialdehyde dehydrogenase